MDSLGDFNVSLNEDEKLGGLPFEQQEVTDFALFISNCSLMELKFTWSIYTWWNGKIKDECIFKRLDRLLVNTDFLDSIPSSEVHYLIRERSDHALLHLICNTEGELVKKPFQFLNFWTKHNNFKEVVRQHWVTDFVGSPFVEF